MVVGGGGLGDNVCRSSRRCRSRGGAAATHRKRRGADSLRKSVGGGALSRRTAEQWLPRQTASHKLLTEGVVWVKVNIGDVTSTRDWLHGIVMPFKWKAGVVPVLVPNLKRFCRRTMADVPPHSSKIRYISTKHARREKSRQKNSMQQRICSLK